MCCLKLLIENQKAVNIFLKMKAWSKERGKGREMERESSTFYIFSGKICHLLLTFSLTSVLYLSTEDDRSACEEVKMSAIGNGCSDSCFL